MKGKRIIFVVSLIFCVVLIGCSKSSMSTDKTNDQGKTGSDQIEAPKTDNQIIKYDDLNSDGIQDKIILTLEDSYHNKYALQVNDLIIDTLGDNIEPNFNIIDIDASDKYKEIAVSEYGPSSDDATTFYFFNGKEIIPMGKIGGFFGIYYSYGNDAMGEMKINGSGEISTRTRGKILQTWFYQDEFRLSDKHLLLNVPKDLYKMNTEVEVIKEISLQKSRNDTAAVLSLKPGEKATIVSSDNRTWCLVRNDEGETGWFAVVGYDTIKNIGLSASEVFNGLCHAD